MYGYAGSRSSAEDAARKEWGHKDEEEEDDLVDSSREADGQVAPRYDSSHPEGFVDHRYSDHKGNLGQKEAKKKEKSWTGRQRDMHKDIGEQIARESRSGRPSGPIRVSSDPDHPIDLKSISSRPVVREGWHGGMSYSPPISRIKKETTTEFTNIKEF